MFPHLPLFFFSEESFKAAVRHALYATRYTLYAIHHLRFAIERRTALVDDWLVVGTVCAKTRPGRPLILAPILSCFPNLFPTPARPPLMFCSLPTCFPTVPHGPGPQHPTQVLLRQSRPPDFLLLRWCVGERVSSDPLVHNGNGSWKNFRGRRHSLVARPAP